MPGTSIMVSYGNEDMTDMYMSYQIKKVGDFQYSVKGFLIKTGTSSDNTQK